MSEGAEGYVTEIPYTPGYHDGLDPTVVTGRLEQLGVRPPSITRACELGFGRGINLAMHAVAGPIEWWGNDLLSEHVAGVQALTAGLTDRLHVSAETFADFCRRADLPQFDFVALHGIWSWVSAENRQHIREFIDRHLAPGGVVYLSYNVLAGWRAVLPLRDFLYREAHRPQVLERPLAERIELALRAAQAFVASDPAELADNREFEGQLRRIRHQRKAYLAHEYFNRDWVPFSFAEVAAALSPIGLTYAGQIVAAESSAWHAQPAERIALEDAEDRRLQRRFRRDLWLRDPQARAPNEARSVRRLPSGATIAATRVLNDRLLQWAISEPQLSVVASPLTGGGVDLGWRGLLALAAWRAGVREPAAIASAVFAWLDALGHPLLHRDTVISDPREARQVLEREAVTFCHATVPHLRELLIEPAVSG